MRGLIAAALVAALSGCASAPQTADSAVKPTHYWAAKSDENRYRVDNLACQSETQAASGNSVFEPRSEAFKAYQDCMVSRGYTLRQY